MIFVFPNKTMGISAVWTYFTKSDDKKRAVCCKCKKSYSASSTSSLYYHLQHSHHTFLQKVRPNNNKKIAESSVDRPNLEEQSTTMSDPDTIILDKDGENAG